MGYMLELLCTLPTVMFSLPLFVLSVYWFFSAILGFIDLSTDVDIDVDIDSGLVGKMLFSLGISKVPIVIGFTFVFLFGTIISFFCEMIFLSGLLSYENYFSFMNIIIGALLFFPILIVSMLLTSVFIKITRLDKLFGDDSVIPDFDYVGSVAKIHSNSLTKSFGEIVVKDSLGNDHYLTASICETSNIESLKRGSEVVIVSFVELNKDSSKYIVVPKD